MNDSLSSMENSYKSQLKRAFGCIICYESRPNSFHCCFTCGRYLGCFHCCKQILDKRCPTCRGPLSCSIRFFIPGIEDVIECDPIPAEPLVPEPPAPIDPEETDSSDIDG